jgi:hypothetical protein
MILQKLSKMPNTIPKPKANVKPKDKNKTKLAQN